MIDIYDLTEKQGTVVETHNLLNNGKSEMANTGGITTSGMESLWFFGIKDQNHSPFCEHRPQKWVKIGIII